MKDRIVIEKTKEFRPHPALREGVNCIDTKYCQYEQVPENWEDLKELCKNLKEEDILVTRDFIDFRDLHFYKSGLVCIPDSEYFSISTGRTPAQMWQIIKGLMEE